MQLIAFNRQQNSPRMASTRCGFNVTVFARRRWYNRSHLMSRTIRSGRFVSYSSIRYHAAPAVMYPPSRAGYGNSASLLLPRFLPTHLPSWENDILHPRGLYNGVQITRLFVQGKVYFRRSETSHTPLNIQANWVEALFEIVLSRRRRLRLFYGDIRLDWISRAKCYEQPLCRKILIYSRNSDGVIGTMLQVQL